MQPIDAPDYNDDELLVVLMAREVRDNEVSACGALSHLWTQCLH